MPGLDSALESEVDLMDRFLSSQGPVWYLGLIATLLILPFVILILLCADAVHWKAPL